MNIQQFMDRSSSLGSDSRIVSTSGWEDELGQGSDELFFVSTYSDFEKLGKPLMQPDNGMENLTF